MIRYDFRERLRFSQGHDERGVRAILLNRIPSAVAIMRANGTDDRNGTDYWVARNDPLPALSVDVKVREEDFAARTGPSRADDLALEIWSDLERRVIGWTRDERKRTDYVLWFWADTARFVLVPFHPLCHVFRRRWAEWARTYRTAIQDSGTWRSECVFVPRFVVLSAITQSWACGRGRDTLHGRKEMKR